MNRPFLAATLLAANLLFLSGAFANVPMILNYQGRLTTEGLPANGPAQFKFALSNNGVDTAVRAEANAVVAEGKIMAVQLVHPGFGYTSPPQVEILDHEKPGSGAEVIAVVTNGHVSNFLVESGGSGYSDNVSIVISAPPPLWVFETYWSNDGTTGQAEPSASVEVPITDGFYSVALGDPELMIPLTKPVLNHEEVYIRVWVRPQGQAGFVELLPRQRLHSVAYSIMAATVDDGAIGTQQLAEGAVTGNKIASGAITGNHVATRSLTGSNVAEGALDGSHFASGSIIGSALAPGSIQEQHIVPGAVDSTKIAPGSITADKIAPGTLLNHPDLQGLVNLESGSTVILGENEDASALLHQGFLPAGNFTSADKWYTPSQGVEVTGRQQHEISWAHRRLFVWGGLDAANTPLGAGQLYDPEANLWSNAPAASAPQAAYGHTVTAISGGWVVWGGWSQFPSSGALNTGAFYRSATNDWATFPAFPDTPAARAKHSAIWTGSELIVWGGLGAAGTALNSGGKYIPDFDEWTPTSTVNAPAARWGHTAVWTGTHMIVWGGRASNENGARLASGAVYDPAANTWQAMSTTNAPLARYGHAAVWTGTRMLVWGGYGLEGPLNDGAQFDPATNSWSPINNTNPPAARQFFAYAWTGENLIVYGGLGSGLLNYLSSAAIHGPNGWSALPTAFSPAGRAYTQGAWTGSEFVAIGGLGLENDNLVAYSDGGSYRPSPGRWLPVGIRPTAEHFGYQAVGDRLLTWTADGVYQYEGKTNRWYKGSNFNAPPRQAGYDIHPAGQYVIFWDGPNRRSRYNYMTNTWHSMSVIGQPPIRGQSIFRNRDGLQELFVFNNSSIFKYSPVTNTWSNVATSGTGPGNQVNMDNVQAWYIQNNTNRFSGSDFTLLINPDFPHYRFMHSTNEWVPIEALEYDALFLRQVPKNTVAVLDSGIASFDGFGKSFYTDAQGVVAVDIHNGMSYPRRSLWSNEWDLPNPVLENPKAVFTGTEIIAVNAGATGFPSGGARFHSSTGRLSGLNVPQGFSTSGDLQWVEDRVYILRATPANLGVFEPGKNYTLYVKP